MIMKLLIVFILLCPVKSFADLIVNKHIDQAYKGRHKNVTEDNTWMNNGEILLNQEVKVLNYKINYNRNCLEFYSPQSPFLKITVLPLQYSEMMLTVPVSYSTLSTDGDKSLGTVREFITGTGQRDIYFTRPGNDGLGMEVVGQINNRCYTPQNFDLSGILDFGHTPLGTGENKINFRAYGIVYPANKCAISVPTSIDIGEHTLKTINGKQVEATANIACIEKTRASIKFQGLHPLHTINKNCMYTNKRDNLIYCFTLNSKPVNLSGDEPFFVDSVDEIGTSGSELIIGVEARLEGSNAYIGHHSGSVFVTISPE